MRHSPALTDGHHIQLIEGGQAYFESLIKALDQAQSHVLLETYIFDVHGAAVAVAEAMHTARNAGLDLPQLLAAIQVSGGQNRALDGLDKRDVTALARASTRRVGAVE